MYDSGYSPEERVERAERRQAEERRRAVAEVAALRMQLVEAVERLEEKRLRLEEKQLRRTLRTPGGVEAFLSGKPVPTPEEVAARKEEAAFSRAYGPAGKMGSRKDLFRDSLMRGRRR